MSKILYNRAAKLFMDKISAGYDEMGAHAAVEKKYGVRLADTILGDARAEMKAMRRNPRGAQTDMVLRSLINVDYANGHINKAERDARLKEVKENPRGRHRYLDWKKQTEEAAEELAKKQKKNPRENVIEIGKIVDDENGIEKMVVVEKGHPGRTNYRVYAEPTKKGKETMAYREMRAHLGDHWFSDITDSWFLPESGLSKKMQEKINKVVEEVKSEGYTRY